MENWFIKLAALYFFFGILVGMYMSITHNFDMAAFHAHVNLLGWVSTALFGLIYNRYAEAAGSALYKWHFWLYNLGFIVMMFGLFFVLRGTPSFEPVIAVGATSIAIGVLLFVINLWRKI